MATLNLYLSDELKARMGRRDLNWSRIAASAITDALNLEDRKEVDMEAASLERLRLSRDKADDRSHADGFAAGKRWALEHADYQELAAVAALAEGSGVDFDNDPSAYGWGHVLADAVLGVDAWGRPDLEAWCEVWIGAEYPTAEAVRGFIEGAAEVFAQV